MAAPLPRPRLARPSQESAGNGLDLPPPPSFPPPNRPNAPPNELEQVSVREGECEGGECEGG